ncbi:hypothetical protein ACFSKL_01770 [Belliella marina]|uniref:Uncharacterized protein n=1 Tax=Belliella marina TaxID=1644146 RepID=A0ABW4VHH5_9BACT
MKKVNYWLSSAFIATMVVFSSCKDDDERPDMMDDSFYAVQLGGETKVPDPNNSGQMVEQGFLNLRTVVTNTVLTIATNEDGKYDALQPYFSVLLNEVGNGQTSGFTALVGDFTEFLAEATGSKNFTYSGLDMESAHDPAKNSRMNGRINNADYNLFIQAVVEGAAQANITSNDVLGPVGQLLESVREPIVQRADGEALDLYTRLGGNVMVDVSADNEPERLVEAGYAPLEAVVTSTVLIIAGNEGGKYDALQPYFSVLLSEVGANEFSGFTTLVKDFSELLAESIGSVNIEYSGLNMVDAHNPATNPRMTGLVSSEDYDLFIGAVVEGAMENNVPQSVIGEFGALLTSPGLKNAIVQR